MRETSNNTNNRTWTKYLVAHTYYSSAHLEFINKLRIHYTERNTLNAATNLDKDNVLLDLENYFLNLTLTSGSEQLNREQRYQSENSGEFTARRAEFYDNLLAIEHPIGERGIFTDITDRKKEAGRVAIIGDAGTGKTTLSSRYIPYRWAKGNSFWYNRFDFVFCAKLSLLNRHNDLNNISQLIEKTLREEAQRKFRRYDTAFIDSVLEQFSNQVLIILDGYDEVKTDNGKRNLREIIKDACKYPNVLLTSRPVILQTNALFKKNFRWLELVGFTRENILSYTLNYFGVLSSNETEEVKATEQENLARSEFITRLIENNHEIMGLCRVPVNLYFLCLTVKGMKKEELEQLKAQTSFTLTDLYYKLFEQLAGRDRYHPQRGKAPSNSETVEEGTADEETKDSGLAEAHSTISFMGKLAFAMTQANQVRASPMLYDICLENTIPGGDEVAGNRKTLSAGTRDFGILRAAGCEEADYLRECDHYFAHLTLQEFCTAWHVAEVLAGRDHTAIQEMAKFINQHRNDPSYDMVWRFVAGLTKPRETRIINGKPGVPWQGKYHAGAQYFWDALLTYQQAAVVGYGDIQHAICTDFSVTRRVNSWRQYADEAKLSTRTPSIPAGIQALSEAVRELKQRYQNLTATRLGFTKVNTNYADLMDQFMSTSATPKQRAEARGELKKLTGVTDSAFDQIVDSLTRPQWGVVKRVAVAALGIGAITIGLGFGIAIASTVEVITLEGVASALFLLAAAAQALTDVIKESASANPEVVKGACRWLSQVARGNDTAIAELITTLTQKNASSEAQVEIIKALGCISYKGERTIVPALLEHLNKIAVSQGANQRTHRPETQDAFAALGRCLFNSKTEIVLAIIKTLAQVAEKDDTQVIRALKPLLTYQHNYHIRETAAYALGQVTSKGNGEVSTYLTDIYGDIRNSDISVTLGMVAAPENSEVITMLFNHATSAASAGSRNQLMQALANIPAHGVLLTTLYDEAIGNHEGREARIDLITQDILKRGWHFVVNESEATLELEGNRYAISSVNIEEFINRILASISRVTERYGALNRLTSRKGIGSPSYTGVFAPDFIPAPPRTERELLKEVKKEVQTGFAQNNEDHKLTRANIAEAKGASTRVIRCLSAKMGEIAQISIDYHNDITRSLDSLRVLTEQRFATVQNNLDALNGLGLPDQLQKLSEIATELTEVKGTIARIQDQGENTAAEQQTLISNQCKLTEDIQRLNTALTLLEQRLEELGLRVDDIEQVIPKAEEMLGAKPTWVSPEEDEYYQAFCKTLSASYLASLVIGTHFVRAQSDSLAGNAANIFTNLGGLVPGGTPLKVIGAVIAKGDQIAQLRRLERITAIAMDPTEMVNISRALGKKLVRLYTAGLSIAQTGQARSPVDKLISGLEAATSLAGADNASAAITGLADTNIERLIADSLTADEQKQEHGETRSLHECAGEEAAELVLLGVTNGSFKSSGIDTVLADLSQKVYHLGVFALPLSELCAKIFTKALNIRSMDISSVTPGKHEKFMDLLTDYMISHPRYAFALMGDEELIGATNTGTIDRWIDTIANECWMRPPLQDRFFYQKDPSSNHVSIHIHPDNLGRLPNPEKARIKSNLESIMEDCRQQMGISL